jgi:hypothetical protein
VDPRSQAEAARSVSAVPNGGGALRRRLGRVAEPLARSQRVFNDAILRVTDALSERIDTAAARAEAADRRARGLEEVRERRRLLARQAGFAATDVRYLNAPDPHPDPRISEQLFAPLDYLLIAAA